jgi:hypothetical protein
MPKAIEFISEEEGIVARAELLEDEAPKTCNLIWELLPITAHFTHAIYSGSELAMILPSYYEIDNENATTTLLPWEIFFASLKAKDYFDVDQDFSEIAFFYDRNTGPRMLDGLVKVNVFARFVSEQDKLLDMCLGIRNGEGRKEFTVRRVDGK